MKFEDVMKRKVPLELPVAEIAYIITAVEAAGPFAPHDIDHQGLMAKLIDAVAEDGKRMQAEQWPEEVA